VIPPAKVACCSWSGGKDSCLALHRALRAGLDVRTLVTMLDESGDRSRSHAIAPEVLRDQASALGRALVLARASWADYERVLVGTLRELRAVGHDAAIFGDIDLAPHREWEERVAAAAAMTAHLPLWGEPRRALVDEFLDAGFRAVVVCVNGGWLDRTFAGREFDRSFLADLPANVDPCGENGEFHTFVYDGPLFERPVRIRRASVDRYDAGANGETPYFYQRLELD
jgi:uncharacterized protein (TIGR00290 family)